MSGEQPGLTGHVLDLSALSHLSEGASRYGAEVVRQASMYGITLIVPAAAAHYLAAFYTTRARFLDLSMILIAPLTADAISDTTPFVAPLRAAAKSTGAEPPMTGGYGLAVLAAAHAVVVSRARGWRLLTAVPHLYQGVDVRTEILP